MAEPINAPVHSVPSFHVSLISTTLQGYQQRKRAPTTTKKTCALVHRNDPHSTSTLLPVQKTLARTLPQEKGSPQLFNNVRLPTRSLSKAAETTLAQNHHTRVTPFIKQRPTLVDATLFLHDVSRPSQTSFQSQASVHCHWNLVRVGFHECGVSWLCFGGLQKNSLALAMGLRDVLRSNAHLKRL